MSKRSEYNNQQMLDLEKSQNGFKTSSSLTSKLLQQKHLQCVSWGIWLLVEQWEEHVAWKILHSHFHAVTIENWTVKDKSKLLLYHGYCVLNKGWHSEKNLIKLPQLNKDDDIFNYYYNHFTSLWTLSGFTRVSQYQKKHSPTHIYRDHQSSLICFLCLLRPMASSLFNLHAWQSFSTISFQSPSFLWSTSCPGTLHFILHIFLHHHCLLFTAHAHTIATRFAVVPKLCHLILISLSTLYLKLYLVD